MQPDSPPDGQALLSELQGLMEDKPAYDKKLGRLNLEQSRAVQAAMADRAAAAKAAEPPPPPAAEPAPPSWLQPVGKQRLKHPTEAQYRAAAALAQLQALAVRPSDPPPDDDD